MILQYFKKKENNYKDFTGKIYISILEKSKILINKKYFRDKNFDSSFEIVTIILIFYLSSFKKKNDLNCKKINEQLMNHFVNDLDITLRNEGIGDMSIGKYVKKYVKKFYYRVKKIDFILNNFNKKDFLNYLYLIKNIDKKKIDNLVIDLMEIYGDIKKNNVFL
ncbi:MAG: hypothetical protein CMP16_03310 [Rickettsiales bacterium]|nr:hypothetical protein [Rickettsiales bacterium]|tara:strand:- start:471 stop:962 length:492 start_codon:yes stop_codon:yes gene_type:complete